jgi:DHA3 family multidrug efflux protein-like MFS transporter
MFMVSILAIFFTLVSAVHLRTIPIPELPVTEHHQSKKHLDIRGTLKAINSIPGFMALILFTTINNFLGGVYMSLMDAYGLSIVSVQAWGILWGVLSTGFIIGGLVITKVGLGKNPLKTMFAANFIIWVISSVFTINPSIVFLMIGMYIYITLVPFIEAAEQTIVQKVVPPKRQGRVFGFAHSIEQAASPITAFLIGPLAQFFFIPFMTDGWGAKTIGNWFGTGPSRGIALVFTLTGIIGFFITLAASRSRFAKLLANQVSS